MLRMRWVVTGAGVVLGGGGLAAAQSFNIDFGQAAGVPDSSFAAAGAPGVWNSIETDGVTTVFPLVDLSGAATGVTLRNDSFSFMSVLHTPSPNTTGQSEALLDDSLFLFGDVLAEFYFEGLQDGMYDLTLYGIQVDHPDEPTVFTWLSNDFSEFQDDVTGDGAYTGVFEEGVTHTTFRVPVVDGTLYFIGTGVFNFEIESFGNINGIQLQAVPAPGAMAVALAGLGAFARRRRC